MGRALGMGSGGRAFPRFLGSKAMAGALGAELVKKIENPLKFQWGGRGAGDPPRTIYGFDSTILIDICNDIIAAEANGALKTARYSQIVQQAHIIVGACAKQGIRHVVYALAGYSLNHPLIFLGVISIYYGTTEELTTMLSVNTKLGPLPSSSRFFMRCSTDKSKSSIRSVQVKLPSQK